NVTDLVFLCAMMTPEGTDVGALLSEHGSMLFGEIAITDVGMIVNDGAIGPSLYADCSPDDIVRAKARLRPMPANDPPPPPVRPGYVGRSSTYVVCTQDQAVPLLVQRMFAAHADHVVEWDVSHSPFLSRPDLVVDLLAGLAGG